LGSKADVLPVCPAEDKPLLWHEKIQGKTLNPKTPFEGHVAPHKVLIAKEFSEKFIRIASALIPR